MLKRQHFQWKVDLKASPQALWPLIADNNRFNRDTGLAPVQYVPNPPGKWSYTYHFIASLGGQEMEWDEVPFSWVYPHHFETTRSYKAGPLTEMRLRCEMTPRPEGGTHLEFHIWGTPRNKISEFIFPLQIKLVSDKKFLQVFQEYDRIAAEGGSAYDLPASSKPNLSAGGIERLQSSRASLVQSDQDKAIHTRMIRLLEQGDDMTLHRIRPYQVADLWGTPRRATLEYMLRASRAGLLDVYWDLLCPMCRGAQASQNSLAQVHNETHCDFCDINYTVNFDRQVEIIFRPNPAVRVVPEPKRYCLTGPQAETHVLMNEWVQPGETRVSRPLLAGGKYLLNAYGICDDLPVLITPDGKTELALITKTTSLPAELELGPQPTISLHNPTNEVGYFSLQRIDWRDDAATAADVSTLQVFRDLFPREALRAGQEINVGSVTLMFTDLRDSTRMYREIGDGPAFGRVRQHFDILEQAIAREGGAVVKTIGDAVMAVFNQPISAVLAIQTVQQEIHALGHDPTLSIKAGIHCGPCIIVTLNERLDYFGTTVNTTARLPGLSHGGEVILTDEIINDPEVATWLQKNNIRPEHFHSHLKGFDNPTSLWRTTTHPSHS